ncbi:neuropeptide FF receptor 1-like [Ptychodera flava]|uniref:neuropeptide FF receptor 1-like n=1 Tax=Ptychodera flava TaxID=63121 RepID=UPI00396A6A04
MNTTENSTSLTPTTSGSSDDAPSMAWVNVCKIIMSIVGLTGNFLVCLVFIGVKRLRTTTNYFIVSLGVADLISSFMIMPIPIPQQVSPGLQGELYCRVIFSGAFLWISFKASVFNLVAVTIERYFAIVHSVKHKIFFTKRRCLYILAVVWLCAFILESLAFYIFLYDHSIKHCIIWWPNDNYRLAVAALLFLASFLIPVVILIIMYIRILVFLKRHTQTMLSRNENNSPAFSLLKAREKIVKMLFLVVITFTVCWAPNQTLFMALNYGAALDLLAPYYQFFILLAFCNSCMNPIIYSFKNKQFRDGLKVIFCKQSMKVVPGSSDNNTQNLTVASNNADQNV